MPSTSTITAFNTFLSGTKARAEQVNANFDVFRGHIIPVDASATTAANNSYDLGGLDYRWREGFIAALNLGLTTTSWKIEAQTTTQLDILQAGSTIASLDSIYPVKYAGNQRRVTYVDPLTTAVNTTPPDGNPVYINEFDISITVSGFRDVFVGFGVSANISNTQLGATFSFGNTVATFAMQYKIDTTTAAPSIAQRYDSVSTSGAPPASSFNGIVRNLSAGAHTLKFSVREGNGTAMSFIGCAVYAYEI